MDIQPKDTSKGHFYVSIVKSFVRVAAGVALILSATQPGHTDQFIVATGALLIVAEILGIVEEIV